MRIYTTTLLLTCTVLLATAFEAMALPTFTITNVKHACGGQANGSFDVRVTAATPGSLRIRVIGVAPFEDIDSTFTPTPGLPFVFPVTGVSGLDVGQTYVVIVSDPANKTDLVDIFDFTVTLNSVTDNTNPGCGTPNGAIDVTTAGMSPAGAIQYTWTGPGGPYNTEDLSGRIGGDYSLSYTDGFTTCNLGPIHIDDPAPTAFTISSPDPDICAGSALTVDISTADNGWIYSVMEGATVHASAPGGGGPLSIPVPGLSTGPHTLRVRARAGVCPDRFNDAPNLAVTVNPLPVGTNSATAICANAPVNIILSTNPMPVPAATFDIAVTPNGLTQVSGTPSAGLGKLANEIADDVWANTGLGSVNVIYTITPISAAPASCPGNSFTVNIDVNPQPVGSNMIATTCSDVAVGVTLTTSGASVPASTYTISTNNGGLTQVGGTVSAGTGKAANELADDVWRNVGLVAVDVIYTVTPVSASICSGNPFTVTVTINPEPVGANALFTRCSDQVVGVTLTSDPASVAASSYSILVNANGLTQSAGTPSAGAGKADTEIADDVWRNTGLLPVNVVYTITPVSVALCQGNPFTVTITVNPEPVGSSSTAITCSDQVLGINLTTSGASVAAATYTISVNSNGLTQVGGTASAGGGKAANELADDVWGNLTNGPVDVVYTIAPVSAAGCAGDIFTVTVTINPEPIGVAQAVTVCSDALVNVTVGVAPGSAAAPTYSIAVNASGLVFNGTTVSAGTGKLANELMDDRWINTGMTAVNVIYTITPVSGSACVGDPFTVTVTVDPGPVGANATNTTCSDELIGVSLSTSGSAVPAATYNILINANGLTFSGVSPSAGTGKLSTELDDDRWTNTSPIDVNVIYSVTPVSAAGCAGNPFTIDITVNPEPVGVNTTSITCSDDIVGFNLSTPGAFTYNISVNPNGLSLVGGTDSNGNGKLFTEIGDDVWHNVGTGPVGVVYTVVPISIDLCLGGSFTVTITVNPEPVGVNASKSICSNDNINYDLQADNLDLLGNGLAGTTFEWTAADNTNVSGEEPGTGITPTIDDILINTTSVDQVVVYTVIPVSFDGCEGSPFTVTITVSPRPVVIAETIPICAGVATAYEIRLNPANMPVGTVFSWPDPDGGGPAQASPPGGVPMGAAGTIHINDVLTIPGSVIYVVTPSLGGACSGNPENIEFVVDQAALAEAGLDQIICTDNGPYPLAGSSIGGAASDGTWSIVSTGGDGAVAPPGALLDPSTASFIATLPGDYILELRTNDPPGICVLTVDQVMITVTNKPVVTPGQSPTVCGNDPLGYEIQMDVADLPLSTIFTWADPDGPTGTTNATGSPVGGVPMGTPGTVHIKDILINETNAIQPVTYQVTPSLGLCFGAPTDIVVNVKPSPVVGFGQTKTICSGERVDQEIVLTPANLPAGTKFSWPIPNGIGATSKDNIVADPAGTFHITDTLYNASGAPVTVIYKVVSQGVNGCYGRTRDVNIIVNSGAIADAGPARSICSNGVLTLSGASMQGVADATWTIFSGPPGGDGVITNGTATTTPATATFQAVVPGDYMLQLTTGNPTTGSCLPVSDIVRVTVKAPGDPSCTGSGGCFGAPAITATFTATDATCNNNDGSIVVNNLTGGTGPYTFTLNGSLVNLPANNTFAGLTANTYTIEVTDAASCVKTFAPVLISFPGFINYTVPVITEPDCTGNGSNGRVDLTISDPGTFEFAITTDLIIPPTTFNVLGGSLVSIPKLSRGDYAVWLRPVGAGVKCATKIPVTITGVYAVSYTATTSDVVCFAQPTSIVLNAISGAPGLPYSYTLTNTSDNSVTSGTVTASQALAAFSITNISRGNYSILLTQDQSSVAPACTLPISGGATALVVHGPTALLDSLYVKRTISYPDLATGSAVVGVSPSGLEPYETRLELTTPLFASQEFVSDWTEAMVNPQNLKFETSYTDLFAGVYTMGIRDAGGCERTFLFVLNVYTDVFVPNIFTPNGDGHNEVFYIRNLPADSKLLVTNRWGKEVYKSSSYTNDWNGGDTVDGLYYYTLNAGGQNFTGWVEIMRGQ